ncbi:MAG: methyltransferase domain-containing protein, partial [Actinobacteria bacterium]|nr:methyltransferase domain-containing protein [Actinomycetota bacterium]
MAIDQAKLEEFTGRFAGDFAAAMHAATVVVGDKLGLYRALAEAGPIDGAGLAARTGYDRRLVEEWLCAQYVSRYCEHDPATGTFWLTEEQAAALADESSPALLVGAMTIAASAVKDEERIRERFATGRFGWHEHHRDLFEGTERLFKPGYVANLVPSWLPALEGVEEKLLAGARVADIGCGHGASTIVMAKAYPNSQFVGFDYHAASVAAARRAAERAGVAIGTGDTKVVERGKADGVYISTSGVAVVEHTLQLSPASIRPGDRVIASGTLGDHGMAIMVSRGELELEVEI